jgi:hypothetical protein
MRKRGGPYTFRDHFTLEGEVVDQAEGVDTRPELRAHGR